MVVESQGYERFIPFRVRRYFRTRHQRYVFQRAMKRFLSRPEDLADASHPLLKDLVYGWGNASWSGSADYLARCLRDRFELRGPSVECGSGLSTVLIGAIADRAGQVHWALEHSADWGSRVQRCLDEYGIGSVRLSVTALRDYGEYEWYDPPLEEIPDAIRLAICDGPPGRSKGGRYGFLPVMRTKLETGCVILVDDIGRASEQAMVERWRVEFGVLVQPALAPKPYARLALPAGPIGTIAVPVNGIEETTGAMAQELPRAHPRGG